MWRLLRCVAVTVAAAVVALPAVAQQYPTRTVRLIVPFAAGGTGDIVARVLSDRLAAALGQPVVVENRPGATGALGSKMVASAAPDGHTLLVGQTGEMAINQHWAKGLGYDPEADFQPVALATIVPLAMVVPGKAAYGSVAEMLAVARARGLAFASSGAATPGHLAGEVLKLRTKVNMTHVPYNGAGPALNDILGGHVGMFFSGFPPTVPHVQAGTMKLLAVSTARRSSVAPDVPTVAEASGIADFDIALWQGFFAPRGTSRAIVDRLHAEIGKLLVQEDIRARLLAAGAEVAALSTDAFTAFTRSESAKFLRIITEAGLKPE